MDENSGGKKLAEAANAFVATLTEVIGERAHAVLHEPMVTMKQVAEHFNVHPRSVSKWMAKGLIPYYKIGASVRFKISAIEAHWDRNYRVAGWGFGSRPYKSKKAGLSRFHSK